MSKLYKTIIELCESRGITGYRMCKETGIQPSILTDLKMGRREGISSKNADKIARYFGVPVGYLLGTVTLNEDGYTFSDGSGFGGGSGSGAGFGDGSGYGGPLPDLNKKTPILTEKDERDIARDLELLLAQLESGDDLMFDGDPMSDEAKESIRAAMKLGLEAAKVKNKERFTPKKYRRG